MQRSAIKQNTPGVGPEYPNTNQVLFTDCEISITDTTPNFKPYQDITTLELARIITQQAGFTVIPCYPRRHSKAKAPMGDLTPHGKDDASKANETINGWFGKRSALIGIPCKANGFFAVDLDTPDAVAMWNAWVEQYGLPEPGPWQKTTHGAHFLFKQPDFDFPGSAGKLGPGIDLRNDHYICTGETGSGYEWQIPITEAIPEAPEWLLAKIRGLARQRPLIELSERAAKPPEDPNWVADAWLKHYVSKIEIGKRNHSAYNLGKQLYYADVPIETALGLWPEWDRTIPKVQDNPFTREEFQNTIRSAYSGDKREAALMPAGTNPKTSKPEKVAMVDNPPEDTTEPMANEKQKKPTDDELAEIWIKQQEGKTAFGLGEWRRYQNGIWYEVNENQIKQEIGQVLMNAKGQGIRPTKYINSSVYEFAKLAVYVPDDSWDADVDILPCKNGTLHIPTRTLREHRPEDYATYGLPFDFDPKAEAPVWNYVLNSTVSEAAEFLQEFAGYALTVDTSHEIAIWFYGPSGSGKSTILEGLQTMLGNRATVLGLAEIERSRFALGDLKGKTMAVAAEQPAIYMQATHILNAIISGERIVTERKFKDPITFIPKVKIIWAMNELPRISETGSGLFRRVKVIKFPPLAEKDRDERVKETVKTEGAGILNWALDGLQRLAKRGRFEVPQCVMNASKDFQRHNDVPALFVEDQCELNDEFTVQAQTLYNTYKSWCLDNGHKPQSSTSLAAEWERLGFTKYTAAGRRYYRGLRIKP